MEFSNVALRTRLRTSDEKLFGGVRKASFNKIKNSNYNAYSIWSGITQEANVITEFNAPYIESKYWRHWFRLDTPIIRPMEIVRDMNFNAQNNLGKIVCDDVPSLSQAASKNFMSTINQLIQLSKAVSFSDYSGGNIVHSFEFNTFIEQIFHSIYHPLKYHKFQADIEIYKNNLKIREMDEWTSGLDFTMKFGIVDDGDVVRLLDALDAKCMDTLTLAERANVQVDRINDFIDYTYTFMKGEEEAILRVLDLPSKEGFAGLRDKPVEYAFCKCKTRKGGARIEEIIINDKAPSSRRYALSEDIHLTEGVSLQRKGVRSDQIIMPNIVRREDVALILYGVSIILRVLASRGLSIWDFEDMYGQAKADVKSRIVNSDEIEGEDDSIELLRKYKQLYDEGVLTKDEFETKKQKILKII